MALQVRMLKVVKMLKRRIMKNIIKTIRWMFTLIAFSVILTGCNDQWDNHVAPDGKYMDGTVLDAIKSNSNLSEFYKMIEETGYDVVLKESPGFTVLAPDNSALSALADADTETKLAMIKNHVAFGIYDVQKLAGLSTLKMMNGKNLPLGDLPIDGSIRNILCVNGVLHMINMILEPRMNINEYLSSLPEDKYIQLDSLYAKTERVMDMDKSVPVKVNENGQIVYDTVWITQNSYFQEVPINDEDSMYTFILLENENFNTIKTKFAKYMKQATQESTDSKVTDELIRDLILRYDENSAVLSGITVDFSGASLISEYKASNGIVRIMNGVDVKMKNKLKTVVIEAEDYISALDDTKLVLRTRPWASGGKDVMLSSRTYQQGTDGVTYSFTYSSTRNTNSNYYIHYEAGLYSTSYDVYWLSFDDMNWSEYGTPPVEGISASKLKICQKLFASMPGSPLLGRPDPSNPAIVNNYLGNTVAFAASSKSGVMQEERLCKYSLGSDAMRMVPVTPVDEPDPYAFSVPQMGNVMFMVCNTAGFGEEYENLTDANRSGGMMFLDYIKLVPRIEEGD